MKRFVPIMVAVAIVAAALAAAISSLIVSSRAQVRHDDEIRGLRTALADARAQLQKASEDAAGLKQALGKSEAKADQLRQQVTSLRGRLASAPQPSPGADELGAALSFEEKANLLISKLGGQDAWYYRDKLMESGEAALPYILARLQEPGVSDSEKLMLYQVLTRSRNPELVPWFIAGLSSEDRRIQRQCHRALTSLTHQALPADYDAWSLWYAANSGGTPEDWYTYAVSDVLARLASPEANARADALRFLLRDFDAEGGGLSGDPQVLAVVVDLLTDESFFIRRNALMLLARDLPDEKLLEELAPLVASGEDTMGRTGAVYALGRPGLEEAVPLLEPLLEDPDAQVKRAAFFSLARIGGEEVQPKLLSVYEEAKAAGEDTRPYEFVLNMVDSGRINDIPFAGFGRGPGGGQGGRPGGFGRRR